MHEMEKSRRQSLKIEFYKSESAKNENKEQ